MSLELTRATQKIGPARINCAIKAAQLVINKHPYNSLTGTNQKVDKVRELQTRSKVTLGPQGTPRMAKTKLTEVRASIGGNAPTKNGEKRLYQPINREGIERRKRMNNLDTDEISSNRMFAFSKPYGATANAWQQPQPQEEW